MFEELSITLEALVGRLPELGLLCRRLPENELLLILATAERTGRVPAVPDRLRLMLEQVERRDWLRAVHLLERDASVELKVGPQELEESCLRLLWQTALVIEFTRRFTVQPEDELSLSEMAAAPDKIRIWPC